MKLSPQNHLLNPWVDFLMVGGLGIILLPLCYLLPSTGPLYVSLFGFILSLQFLINFPHFAYSYQLLYTDIGKKLCSPDISTTYRIKMINAAFIVPLILIACFYYGYSTDNAKFLGWMIASMFFFAGWHYVKQGYGMLIVISAINKYYFTDTEKKFLLFNSYSCWILAWLLGEQVIQDTWKYGVLLPEINSPIGLLALLFMICTINFSIALYHSYRRYKADSSFPPINAIIGYISSVYLWILLALFWHPLYLAIIPALHSLQYILFVMKFKSAQHGGLDFRLRSKNGNLNPNLTFFLWGVLLGSLGFFYLPQSLDALELTDNLFYGPTFFILAFHVFINIHHYFIDNVIWRAENADVRKYLFN